MTVSEAINKIATKGTVAIPENTISYYDLVELNDTVLDRTKKLDSYGLKNKTQLILRKRGTAEPSDDMKIKLEDIEIIDKIGQGTSAKVHKAIYKGLEVAVKQLKEAPDEEKFNEYMKEFQQEVQIMRQSKCPNIVKFFGTVEWPGKFCLVMELCSRGSLYHVMNSVVYDFGWDRTFKVAIETVTALQFLHAQNPQILHRDIKSLNLLVTDNFDIKLCDFGISRSKTLQNVETLRKFRGTAVWSAPELLQQQQSFTSVVEYTDKSDVYSFGIVLWELNFRCIKGRYTRPFSEFKELIFDYQIAVQASGPKQLRPSLSPSTPPVMATLIKTCWDATPTTRPSCESILEQLKDMRKDYETHPKLWDKAKEESLH